MKNLNGAGRRLLETIRGFTVAQRTIALIGVAILVLGGVALTNWLGRPTYSPLFTGLSASDASGVVAQLAKDKVDYQLSDGGSTILVPADRVDAERLAAASAGLPSSSTTGYALLDNMGVTASEFQQNVTYKRAIEGELAKTIGSISGVGSASVQLAIPQQTVFSDKQQDPTASVFVNVSTPLTTDQVQAIVHLTAAAYPGLKDTNVSVVDQKGETLSSVGGSPSGSASEQATTYEDATRAKVQAVLDSLLGPGNSTVTVNATVSQSSGTTTSKTYSTPAGAPVLSQSSNTSAYKGSGASGAAGVLGTDTTSTSSSAAGGNGTYTSDQGVKNNAVNQTTTTQTITPGTLTSQSIAVAVNATKAAAIPTSTIQNLVSAAAGVSVKRGDTVTVAAAPFSNAAAAAAKAALAQQQAAQSSDSMTRIITAAIWVVGGLVFFVLTVVLLRKLFRKPERDPLDGGEFAVVPPVLPLDAALGGGPAVPRLNMGNPMAGLPTVPAPTVAMPQPVPVPRQAAEHLSPFERLQADVDALAEAAPDRTAEYLRALMAEGSGA
jgi:flagellar M-ring protein FliF